MAEGVDYSFARPTPSGLKAAGKCFAVRYVGTPTSGKSLDRAEANALRAAGVEVVAVYQTTANFMLTADGAVAARRARDHAVACGMPSGRPIYFALDTDPRSITASGWTGVHRFLDRAAGVLGRARVGVYAGYAGIERLCPHVALWGWQTYAWSGGRVSTKAQLLQYRNGLLLAGGTVDLCRSLAGDYGQWGVSAPPSPPPPQLQLEDDEMFEIHDGTRVRAVIGGCVIGYPTSARRAELRAAFGAADASFPQVNVNPWWFDRISEAGAANVVMATKLQDTLDNGDRFSLLAAAGVNGAANGDLGDRLDAIEAAVAGVATGAVDVEALASALAPHVSGFSEADWDRLRTIVDDELDQRSLATPNE